MNGPRSLFTRLALTHFLVILLFQLLAMQLAYRFVVSPLLHSSARDLTALIELSVRDWQAQPATQREQYAAQLARGYDLRIQSAPRQQDSAPGLLPYGHILQDALRERFGNNASVRLMQQSDTVYNLEITAGDQRLWIAFPHSRVGTNPYPAVLLTLILSSGIGLAASIFLARRLTRPLRSLGETARRIGAGQMPAASLPQDIAELDELTCAFNQMAQEVAQLINNRTTLLAGVSHDLRSPIARLRMALELAADKLDATQYAAMERYLEDMNRLIDDYLDFARDSSRRELRDTDLKEWLQELGTQHSAAPVLHLPAAPAHARIDQHALQRVLGNLLDNAMRYGKPPVEITLTQQPQQVIITVIDHGPGIPERERQKVFQPFTRLEHSRNVGTGGTGLGLAIVSELCRLHGWQVSLQETPGGGLTVSLMLPAIPA